MTRKIEIDIAKAIGIILVVLCLCHNMLVP